MPHQNRVLLGCPFCGHSPKSWKPFSEDPFLWIVQCRHCMCAETCSHVSQEDSENKWNSRYDPWLRKVLDDAKKSKANWPDWASNEKSRVQQLVKPLRSETRSQMISEIKDAIAKLESTIAWINSA